MDLNDIHEAYRDLPESEAFEAFYNADITNTQIKRVLGDDVIFRYNNWIYTNIK